MPTKPNKVMFIDDDKHFLYLIKRIATKIDLVSDIVEAHNGQDALDQLDQALDPDDAAQLPDILFTDLNMPVMDGFAFISTLLDRQKTEPRLKAIKKIIVLTSSADSNDRSRFEELDIEMEMGYLLKQAAGQMKADIERIIVEHAV